MKENKKRHQYIFRVTDKGVITMYSNIKVMATALFIDVNYLLTKSNKKYQSHYTLKNGVEIEVWFTTNPLFKNGTDRLIS